MTGRRWRAALLAPVIVLLGACGGDAQPESAPTADDPEATVADPASGSGPASTTAPDPGDGTAASTSVTTPNGTGAAGDLEVRVGYPDGFPDDFPRPDDAEVVVGSSAVVRGDRVLSVDLTTAGDLDAVVDFYRDALTEPDIDRLLDRVDKDGEPPSANLRFETDDYLGDVFLTSTDAGTSVILTATIPAD